MLQLRLKKQLLMCFNPLTIKNKRSDFDPRFDVREIQVPCGKCADCQQRKVFDWQMRLFATYNHFVNKLHGSCFFYTLTYDNEHLPKTFDRPCFSKYHCQNFIKLFRKYLLSTYCVDSFDYFLVCEYGGQTKRPHYHVLFFLPLDIDAIQFRKLIDLSWPHGFNAPSQQNWGKVVSYAACNYVCKYLEKQDNFSDIYKSVESFIRLFEEDDDFIKYKLEPFKPFHLQSQGIGKYILDSMSEQQKLLGIWLSPDGKELPVPQYIARKLFYDTQRNEKGNIIYRLNEFGVSHKLATLDYNIAELKKQFDSCLVQSYDSMLHCMQFKIGNDFTKDLFDAFKYSLNKVSEKVFDNVDTLSLARYRMVYQGKKTSVFVNYKDDFTQFVNRCIEMPFDYDCREYCYNLFPDFKHFDEIIHYLSHISRHLRYIDYVTRQIDFLQTQRVKNALDGLTGRLQNKILPIVQFNHLNHLSNVKTLEKSSACNCQGQSYTLLATA